MIAPGDAVTPANSTRIGGTFRRAESAAATYSRSRAKNLLRATVAVKQRKDWSRGSSGSDVIVLIRFEPPAIGPGTPILCAARVGATRRATTVNPRRRSGTSCAASNGVNLLYFPGPQPLDRRGPHPVVDFLQAVAGVAPERFVWAAFGHVQRRCIVPSRRSAPQALFPSWTCMRANYRANRRQAC